MPFITVTSLFLFLSILLVAQIRGHICSIPSPLLPTTARTFHFYREKTSALSSLVHSRRIVLTPRQALSAVRTAAQAHFLIKHLNGLPGMARVLVSIAQFWSIPACHMPGSQNGLRPLGQDTNNKPLCARTTHMTTPRQHPGLIEPLPRNLVH